MAQAGKGKLNYRCPSCFMRDLDLDMFYDKDKKEYYCIRCQYQGDGRGCPGEKPDGAVPLWSHEKEVYEV